MTASQELAESAQSILEAQANILDRVALSMLPRDLLGLAGLLACAQPVVGGDDSLAKICIDADNRPYVEYEHFEIEYGDSWLVTDVVGATWETVEFVEAYRIAVEEARA